MRVIAIATAMIAAFGVFALAGCDNNKDSKKEIADVPQANYDLSAASNAKFLKDNAAKAGVTTLPSGLQYRVIKSGSGKSPRGGDLVTVTYKGWLITGKVFDQTQPGQTAQFPANRLIAGWVEALQRMKEGDEWELVIPSELGYGEQGAGADIPPNQVLVFDMQLLQVTPAPQ
ncbi:MAG: FKBP-type peptidyl-prolyl cis-trans isomerase [Proteobacteria bacterium]|nr:FKBP-type peptidyl-prolyl cis-trans isomerase [Pseudomonadota bacterium]